MTVYESRELARVARQTFREARCWACAPEYGTDPKGRRFEGWRVRIADGDGDAVIGYGTCGRGHEVTGACAI